MAKSAEPAVEETKTPQKKGRKPKAAAAVEADAKTSEALSPEGAHHFSPHTYSRE